MARIKNPAGKRRSTCGITSE